jgi:hypothetical protein
MRNKLLILFGGFLILILFGLFSCEDKCGPFPNKYKIVGLDWVNFKAIYSDTAYTRLLLSDIENDSVSYDEYAILIVPKQETYYAQNTQQLQFSLIQSAYACSPVIPKTDEKIDSIVILSESDFKLNYSSGKDLSDLFDIVVLDHANGIYYEKFDLKDYLSTNPNVPSELTLILKEQPNLTTNFEFMVKYYQNGIDDNDFFEFTTNNIVIKRDE